MCTQPKIRNFNGRSAVGGPICVIVPNFTKIGQTVAEIWRFNGFFSKWRPSAIVDLLGADWDHQRRLLGGVYRCAKFGWNRCTSFDNMKLSIFWPFGLKRLFTCPKLGFSGDFTPKMGNNVNKTPKRHILARVRVVWAIKRENPPSHLTCRWVDEKYK